MENPRQIQREEIKIGRRVVIISMIEYKPGWYETIVMNRNGKEFALLRSDSLEKSKEFFDEQARKYKAEISL